MSKKKNNIVSLLAFVRKHQKYTGDKLKKNYNPYESIDKWVESCTIDRGTHAVKAFVLHQDYKKWCVNNSYPEEQIAKCKTFNSVMRELLNYKTNQRNVIFYVNKKVKYEPPKKDKEKKGGQGAKKEETRED